MGIEAAFAAELFALLAVPLIVARIIRRRDPSALVARLLTGLVLLVELFRVPLPLELGAVLLVWAAVVGVFVRSASFVTYALGIAVVACLCASVPVLVACAIAVLTYGDGFAVIIGRSLDRRPLGLGAAGKTFEGMLALWFVSTMAIAILLVVYEGRSPAGALLIGVSAALIVAVAEAQTPGRLDNLVLPFVTAVVVHIASSPGGLSRLGVGAIFGGAFAVVAMWRRWVTVQGGVFVAVALASMFGIGELRWAAPIAVVTAAIGTVTPPGRREASVSQVAARLCPAVAIAAVYELVPGPVAYPVFLAALAAATADAFGTGIGTYTKHPSIPSLPFLVPVPRGTSGGISALGTGAAAFASLGVAALYALGGGPSGPAVVAVIAVSGLIGATVDSVAGGLIQARYQCLRCGRLVEGEQHCNQPTALVRGVRWITGAVVDVLCGVSAGAAAYVLLVSISAPISRR